MIRNHAALISLAVVFSGSFALSTQSVEAKTSRNSSGRAKNYLVPPPPPYTPSMVPSAMGMTNAQALSLADASNGSFALSTESVEAKTSRNTSGRARNYLVPPPLPYIPSVIPSALGMTYAQTITADSDDAVGEKSVNPYSKYIFTRNQGDMSQVFVSYGVEKKIQKHIDHFDSEISSIEKEIGKLLNL